MVDGEVERILNRLAESAIMGQGDWRSRYFHDVTLLLTCLREEIRDWRYANKFYSPSNDEVVEMKLKRVQLLATTDHRICADCGKRINRGQRYNERRRPEDENRMMFYHAPSCEAADEPTRMQEMEDSWERR